MKNKKIKKNALAELAERLIGWSDWFKGQRGTMMERDIRKAQRIVAELAKVPNISIIPMQNWNCRELEAIRNCRAIAEEGAV